jgi:hypothetical protein
MPTSFGALGHLFDTRDSSELEHGNFGRKKVTPPSAPSVTLFGTTLDIPRELVGTTFSTLYMQRKPAFAFEVPFRNDLHKGVRPIPEKCGTTLSPADLRILPKDYVAERRNIVFRQRGMRLITPSEVSSVCSCSKDIQELLRRPGGPETAAASEADRRRVGKLPAEARSPLLQLMHPLGYEVAMNAAHDRAHPSPRRKAQQSPAVAGGPGLKREEAELPSALLPPRPVSVALEERRQHRGIPRAVKVRIAKMVRHLQPSDDAEGGSP